MHGIFARTIVFVGLAGGLTAVSADEPLDLEKRFAELLPDMSADKIEESQAAQLQWEQICRNLCAPGKQAQRTDASRLMASKLGPETSSGARIWLLRQLQYLGGAECVDAVAVAMDDEDVLVRRAALAALTTNPAAAANARLIEQLESTDDVDFKIGLLNALGRRAAPASTAAATSALQDMNEDVVGAAAFALGNIATMQAGMALKARRMKR